MRPGRRAHTAHTKPTRHAANKGAQARLAHLGHAHEAGLGNLGQGALRGQAPHPVRLDKVPEGEDLAPGARHLERPRHVHRIHDQRRRAGRQRQGIADNGQPGQEQAPASVAAIPGLRAGERTLRDRKPSAVPQRRDGAPQKPVHHRAQNIARTRHCDEQPKNQKERPFNYQVAWV